MLDLEVEVAGDAELGADAIRGYVATHLGLAVAAGPCPLVLGDLAASSAPTARTSRSRSLRAARPQPGRRLPMPDRRAHCVQSPGSRAAG